MEHRHSPQILANGLTLYVCACGAHKQKSKVVNGVRVAIWETETDSEKAKRERAIEMLQTEGYGYDYKKQDANDPPDSHDPRNQD